MERIDNFQAVLEEQGETHANEITEIRNEFSEKNLMQDKAITNLNDTTASISQKTIKLQTDVQTNKDGINANSEDLSDLLTKLDEHGKTHTRDLGNSLEQLDNFQAALQEHGETHMNDIYNIRNEISEKNLMQDNAITNLNDTTASISQKTIKLQTDVQTNKDDINEFSLKNLMQDNAITNLNDTTASLSQKTIELQSDVQTNKYGIKTNLEELRATFVPFKGMIYI